LLSAYPCSCGYTLTNPPHHTLPYYPRTKDPSCPLSQLKTIGGGLPPSERGRKTYDWRAAATTWFVFATCTTAWQDLTPGLAPSQHPCMQQHFTPTSSQPTPLHLVAISILAIKLPVRHVPLVLTSVFAKDRTTRVIPFQLSVV